MLKVSKEKNIIKLENVKNLSYKKKDKTIKSLPNKKVVYIKGEPGKASGGLILGTSASAQYQTGVVTFDSTNITITWTKTGSASGTLPLIWEAQ